MRACTKQLKRMEHEQLTSNRAKLEGGFRGEWKARKEQKARLREVSSTKKLPFRMQMKKREEEKKEIEKDRDKEF